MFSKHQVRAQGCKTERFDWGIFLTLPNFVFLVGRLMMKWIDPPRISHFVVDDDRKTENLKTCVLVVKTVPERPELLQRSSGVL